MVSNLSKSSRTSAISRVMISYLLPTMLKLAHPKIYLNGSAFDQNCAPHIFCGAILGC
ncbi:hypothetical protein AGR1B_pa0171 [Agrobacterium fabacearum S56]|nr:hypothetical protein AGR1B_pa0171 [Agrobacterium fabacearum S56]